jgi:hypothetical protein
LDLKYEEFILTFIASGIKKFLLKVLVKVGSDPVPIAGFTLINDSNYVKHNKLGVINYPYARIRFLVQSCVNNK